MRSNPQDFSRHSVSACEKPPTRGDFSHGGAEGNTPPAVPAPCRIALLRKARCVSRSGRVNAADCMRSNPQDFSRHSVSPCEKPPTRGGFSHGGAEGNRTHCYVRKMTIFQSYSMQVSEAVSIRVRIGHCALRYAHNTPSASAPGRGRLYRAEKLLPGRRRIPGG